MTLSHIGDEQEIRNLVQRYADAASRRDPAAIASTFNIDGTWYSPPLGRFIGHEAMLAFFTPLLAPWDVFLQAMMSGVVVVDDSNPDRAVGRWFVQETAHRSEGAHLSISGVYHDEYTRGDGKWLILHRRYDALLRNTNGEITTHPFPTDVPTIG